MASVLSVDEIVDDGAVVTDASNRCAVERRLESIGGKGSIRFEQEADLIERTDNVSIRVNGGKEGALLLCELDSRGIPCAEPNAWRKEKAVNKEILVEKVAHDSTAIVNRSGGDSGGRKRADKVELAGRRVRESLGVRWMANCAEAGGCRPYDRAGNVDANDVRALGAAGTDTWSVDDGEGAVRRADKTVGSLI